MKSNGIIGWMKDFLVWFFAIDWVKTREPGQKDGFGPFAGLGTFALAQGAALTAVAKGEGRDTLVLGIYFVTVVFTVLWVWTLIRETSVMAGTGGAAKTVWTFDPESRQFGRWTLGWTLFLGAMMFGLGVAGLLPNQTVRVAYDGTSRIPCKPRNYQDLNRELDAGRNLDYLWVDWMERSKAASPSATDVKRIFAWVETKSAFPENYKSFSVDLNFQSDFTPQEFVGFLVKREPGAPPRYRQVERRPNTVGIFDLESPDKGEFLVAIGFVEYKSPNRRIGDNDVWLTPHFGGRP